MLGLPTIRAQCTAPADAADREQMTYRGFLAEMLMAACEDRDRRVAIASNESFSGWTKTFTDPGSAPRSSTGSPSALT